MSCYRCNICEGFFDADEVGCEADPNNDCELICLDCHCELDCLDLEEKVEFLLKDNQNEERNS